MMKDEVSLSQISVRRAARNSASAQNLVRFWNESRLRADQAKSASVRSAPEIVPWRSGLEDILKVAYGVETQSRYVGGAWQRVRRLTTPSAGALYPFEVFAAILNEGTYLWDVERSRLVPCGLEPVTDADAAGVGCVNPPGHRLKVLLIVVSRPWLSMKKYRQRGYAYCHLDVGHLAANLAIYSAALGHESSLHLRFSRTALMEHLKLDGLCREPLAVLSFAPAGTDDDVAPVAGPAAGACIDPVVLEPPGERELLCWESLRGILSFDCRLKQPGSSTSAPLVVEPAEVPDEDVLPLSIGRAQPSAAREWRAAILGRRSAKGFRDEPLSVAQIGELLGALRDEGFPTDFSVDASTRLGVRLVARNVDGLAGVFAYASRSHALCRVDWGTADPRPACMHQEISRDAAALVILHAPIRRLLDGQGYSAFAELHFQAGYLAQRLYLAASRIGAVGMTCIGGFDEAECSALARLDSDDEALYVILLGIPDEVAVKQDRFSVAFSHGYTQRED